MNNANTIKCMYILLIGFPSGVFFTINIIIGLPINGIPKR
jgi:hypothetical protein